MSPSANLLASNLNDVDVGVSPLSDWDQGSNSSSVEPIPRKKNLEKYHQKGSLLSNNSNYYKYKRKKSTIDELHPSGSSKKLDQRYHHRIIRYLIMTQIIKI